MCGICGRHSLSGVNAEEIGSMLQTMVHRGPDDSGCYVHSNIGLGSRRLSIIDLETGRQPISNEDGTVWVVCNGEIYNYQSLRVQLEAKGHAFHTHSDVEVIVHL
jgi:asparagine synthase (glutamine-hydrolysing)